jgi:hypothetical protein
LAQKLQNSSKYRNIIFFSFTRHENGYYRNLWCNGYSIRNLFKRTKVRSPVPTYWYLLAQCSMADEDMNAKDLVKRPRTYKESAVSVPPLSLT